MRKLEQGDGVVVDMGGVLRFVRQFANQARYSNAQIDDYSGGLVHQAPLTMQLRARFSHPISELKGTAGFGFWNAPFAPGSRRVRLPKTVWFFFGSPPGNIALAAGVAGHGFKAATMNATHPLFFALLPAAPLGFLLMRLPFLARHLWRVGQYAIQVSEAALDVDITQTHDYRIEWGKKQIAFFIDGVKVHHSPYSPGGRLGFVAWIDNQYAVVTPQGRFGWGLVGEPRAQSLEIEDLQIITLS